MSEEAARAAELSVLRPDACTFARPQRVALVIGQLHVGGTEGQVALLATGLKARGVDVAVAALCETGHYGRQLAAAGVPVFAPGFPAWRRSRGGPANARHRAAYPVRFTAAAGRLFRWLQSWRPDVVHGFLFYAYCITPFVARAAGVPVVVAGRRSLGDFKTGHPWALRLERVATGWTHRVVANSWAVARDTVRRERLADERITVIYNGVHPRYFRPARAATLDAPRPIILCVSNLRPGKGQDDLIRAASLLEARGLRASVALAGEGTQRASLHALAESRGVHLTILGARLDVPSLLAAADVVVMPSHREGLSNALLEAMAAGRPIVATDVGGNREALDGAGVLVPAADPAALADAIHGVLTDGERAKLLGGLARARAAAVFSADAMVERHLSLYRELLR